MAKDPYKYFRIEAREILDGIGQGILHVEKEGASKDYVAKLLRFAHTLKGAARVVKQPGIADHAHAMEDVLAPFREGQTAISRETVTELLRLLDAMTAGVKALDAAPTDGAGGGGLGAGERKGTDGAGGRGPGAGERQGNEKAGVVEKPDGQAAPAPTVAPVLPPTPSSAPLDRRVETVRVDLSEMDSLLEGLFEARVQLGAFRPTLSTLDQAARDADDLMKLLTSRVESAPTDRAAERMQALARQLHGVLGRIHRKLQGAADRVEVAFDHVRNHAERLRLVPVEILFAELERAARDAAQSLHRPIQFRTEGGSIRLDEPVIAALREALIHVVRNAVAHGIEPAADRKAAGKPELGSVRLAVERHGEFIRVTCSDDGRGIDDVAVRKAAVKRGVMSEEAAATLPRAKALRLILDSGVSTTAVVNEVSGRGVGMDVARDVAARLHGEITVESQPGRGAQIRIKFPASLSSLVVLHVESGGQSVALPLESVRKVIRANPSQIMRTATGAMLHCDDAAVPFFPLAQFLPASETAMASPLLRSAKANANAQQTALLVRVDGRQAAVGIDRLHGTQDVVVRQLPPIAMAHPVIAGVYMDGAGAPQRVLAPERLIDGPTAAPPERASGEDALPLLVVDDSLTTRMLEQNILEQAGYTVDVAASAEEGLVLARSKRYGLILSDVEMPGMNGFEFVAATRADPQLRDVPAILVTSCATPEHRQRGVECGARAYIVKGEFHQERFLQTIRDLVAGTPATTP